MSRVKNLREVYHKWKKIVDKSYESSCPEEGNVGGTIEDVLHEVKWAVNKDLNENLEYKPELDIEKENTKLRFFIVACVMMAIVFFIVGLVGMDVTEGINKIEYITYFVISQMWFIFALVLGVNHERRRNK